MGLSWPSDYCYIAQAFLGANANAQANTLLPDYDGQLGACAPWADTVRDDPAYQWAAELHFINTPDWDCHYSRSRDCVDEAGISMNCVDGAIQNYTGRVSNSSVGSDQQEEALKFLVHFIGDIHQPLHCGFTSDRGGNSFKGTFNGKQTNLHSVWDSGMIYKRIDDDFGKDKTKFTQYLISQIQGPWAANASNWQMCNQGGYLCSDEWAMESVSLACAYSYVDADGVTHIGNGFDLGTDYYQRNLPIIEMQLAKAGVRMAHVMNSVFP